jgi:HAD superfamily hydrolase (TIGR01490 family)
MQLVLFDFDGTLTRRDSLWAFLIFTRGRIAVFISILILSPVFVFYVLGFVNGGRLKEILLRWHMKGTTLSELQSLAVEFNDQIVDKMLRTEILEKLIMHKNNGDEVCVVTASCDVWVKPFCDKYQCSLLATEMEFDGSGYSGNFRTPNCNKQEKVVRIKAAYQLENFEKIIAFGNSDDDLPMFALANETYRV